jgi:hypothetical protein
MAAALVRALGGEHLAAASGGIRAAEVIHPKAITAIGAMGWDLAYEEPRDLTRVMADFRADQGIALAAGLDLPALPQGDWQTWELPAVAPDDPEGAAQLASAIETRVKALLAEAGAAAV